MLKQISIILAVVGCVFLIIPLLRMFVGALSFILPLVLLAIVLVFAGFDMKRLYKNREYSLARNFLLILVLAVIFSFIILDLRPN
jgi:4-amino-4-deoxy-L-arabinose transferase-like glycosyltransferase